MAQFIFLLVKTKVKTKKQYTLNTLYIFTTKTVSVLQINESIQSKRVKIVCKKEFIVHLCFSVKRLFREKDRKKEMLLTDQERKRDVWSEYSGDKNEAIESRELIRFFIKSKNLIIWILIWAHLEPPCTRGIELAQWEMQDESLWMCQDSKIATLLLCKIQKILDGQNYNQ